MIAVCHYNTFSLHVVVIRTVAMGTNHHVQINIGMFLGERRMWRGGVKDVEGRGGVKDVEGRGGVKDVEGRGGVKDVEGRGGVKDVEGRGGVKDVEGRGEGCGGRADGCGEEG